MTAKITIKIDSATQDESIASIEVAQPCPDHPFALTEVGYGLAGGGMGTYIYCGECGRILAKDQDIQYDEE